MGRIKTAMKIIRFKNNIFFSKLFNSGNIAVDGKAGDNRCGKAVIFSCNKNSEIRVKKITASDNCHFAAINGGKIEFGDGNFFNRNCTVVARKSIKFGNRCSFGPNVCIYDHDHAFGRDDGEDFRTSDVVIGNNCWVGANSVILRGTTIGDNCVIGAGCIVKGNIPADSLVTSGREINITPIKK